MAQNWLGDEREAGGPGSARFLRLGIRRERDR